MRIIRTAARPSTHSQKAKSPSSHATHPLLVLVGLGLLVGCGGPMEADLESTSSALSAPKEAEPSIECMGSDGVWNHPPCGDGSPREGCEVESHEWCINRCDVPLDRVVEVTFPEEIRLQCLIDESVCEGRGPTCRPEERCYPMKECNFDDDRALTELAAARGWSIEQTRILSATGCKAKVRVLGTMKNVADPTCGQHACNFTYKNCQGETLPVR